MNVKGRSGLQGIAFLALFSAVSVGTTTQPAVPHDATHKEVESIGLTPETKFELLGTLCMNAEGNLLAGDTKKDEIKVITVEGKVRATWKPGVKPHAIHACPDGTVYVGGRGRLAKLDKTGKVLKTVTVQEGNVRRMKVSGVAATEKDLFAAFGRGGSLGSRSNIVRFNRDLGEAKTIAMGLRGCCQRLDMVALDGVLYVAENTRHRIVKYDRDGTVLSKWGRRDRQDIAGFGSCCNPMNLCFGPENVLYTAESGLGRVKRYKPDGTYLGLVGYVGVTRFTRAGHLAASCSNIAIAVDGDGSRVFVQDVKTNIIRVLAKVAKE